MKASAEQDQTSGEQKASTEIPRIGKSWHQRHGSHLPVVAQNGRAKQQPNVKTSQVQKRQQSEKWESYFTLAGLIILLDIYLRLTKIFSLTIE